MFRGLAMATRVPLLRPKLAQCVPATRAPCTFRLCVTSRELSSASAALSKVLPPELPKSSRFAVIELSGTQYKVSVGDIICSELVDMEVAGELDVRRVLMVGERSATIIGSPLISGATVTATCEEQAKGDKVIIFKKKRRKGYRMWNGFRARLTVLRIKSINLPQELEAQVEAQVGEATG